MNIDTQVDKYICCGNCREDLREKTNEFLEHGFIKYLIDQIEFLREEIKEKKNHWTFVYVKVIVAWQAKFSYNNVQINKSSNKVDNETIFHNRRPKGPCFKENSNDLKDFFFLSKWCARVY